MRIPQPPVALLMDFDGVILDSVEIKTEAFATVYAGEAPSKITEVISYQRLHGGVTRRTKFEYFERNIFGRPGDAEALERLVSKYRDLVYEAVVACPFVRGAENFLGAADGRIDLHLISGTPQEELRSIVDRRGLSRYFQTIVGAPTTKGDAFKTILTLNNLIAAETAAIGDATTEYLAAIELGIPFIGVASDRSNSPFPSEVVVVQSLEDLANVLGIG